jgi:hypothetical protein
MFAGRFMQAPSFSDLTGYDRMDHIPPHFKTSTAYCALAKKESTFA